jgi:putative transposase
VVIMPRQARLDTPGALHHVMGRGIERNNIFRSAADRKDFLERLASLTEDNGMAVYAWVFMRNHFHLLCKTKQRPLSSSMRRLLTGYVVNFNKRHKRHGYLFQNRYKSIICQEDAYFTELVRYIHLNPIRAGIVKDVEALNRYKWSGHSALMDNIKRVWQDTDYVLSFFGRRPRDRKKRYLEFVTKGVAQGQRPELVGGGLVRSLGGWSEVMSMRQRERHERFDQRILGDGDFVEAVLSEINDVGKENFRLGSDTPNLPKVAGSVCRVHGVSIAELRSGARRRALTEPRRVLCWLAVRE